MENDSSPHHHPGAQNIGRSLVTLWNGWAYGIALFRALNFEFRSLKFGKNRSFCGVSGILLKNSASDQYFFGLWNMVVPYANNRGPPTTHHPHKRHSSSGGIFGGVVCELSEAKKKTKYAPPPKFCTRDVDCRFCGGGAWISGSETIRNPTKCQPKIWNHSFGAGLYQTHARTRVCVRGTAPP